MAAVCLLFCRKPGSVEVGRVREAVGRETRLRGEAAGLFDEDRGGLVLMLGGRTGL